MKTFPQYNSDLQHSANLVWDWNEAEQALANFRVQYGNGIHESLNNMRKAGVEHKYLELLDQYIKIKEEDSRECDRLYKIGYDYGKTPSRYDIGNFVDTTHYFYNDRKTREDIL